MAADDTSAAFQPHELWKTENYGKQKKQIAGASQNIVDREHTTALDSEWCVVSAQPEETRTSSPISTAEHVDAGIADAIRFARRKSQANQTKNAAAVTNATIDSYLELAFYKLLIVVVSSSRMWDPGGSARRSLAHTYADF
jgi:hypothetical protein